MGDRDRTETGTATALECPPGAGLGTDELDPLHTILGERYQIERRIGEGGMGVVYAARDIHLGRQVAIKLVGSGIQSAHSQARLEREAQAMARVRHPNIVTIHDIGAAGDRLFVVMELVEGGTLAEWLRAERRSWRELVPVFLQAARGLGAAHAAGFVHRDFKPENVLIGKDGVARVTDFGVARLLGEPEPTAPAGYPSQELTFTSSRGVVGTAGYIAPEILRHEPVDARADQFSFCVSLHAALHGERPFKATGGPTTLAETLGNLRPPRGGVAPRWLQRTIARGLARSPRDRWPTMDALTTVIEQRLGRRRLWLVLGGLGLTAATVIATVVMTRSGPASPPDWSPVVIARQPKDRPLRMAVSKDGSTLVSSSGFDAWVEPRTGITTRRHVDFPAHRDLAVMRLSRAGEELFCSLLMDSGDIEIWEIEVGTSQAKRRVPPIGAPALIPSYDFDVGPDGSIAFTTPDGSNLWRNAPTGAVELLLTAAPGEKLMNSVWSPDGARLAFEVSSAAGMRIEITDVASHATKVVSHRDCNLEWLTENSLACGSGKTSRNATVTELLLEAGGGEAAERVRYHSADFQSLSWFYTSTAGALFATMPTEQHLGWLSLGAPGDVKRIASGNITDLPAAGWTSSGSLIFGGITQGHLRVMATHPDGSVETVHAGPAAEVPLVVLGESIVFGRFPGGESTIPFLEVRVGQSYPDGELVRLALFDHALQPLGPTRGFVEVLCAGGKAPPCLLAERSGADVIAIDWDPETGARGRERARWSMTSDSGRGALSPDGKTLAQVQKFRGLGEIWLLDLASGTRRRVSVPEGTFLDHPRWQPDGTLLATAWGDRDRGIVRLREGAEIETVAIIDEPNAVVGPFQISLDGKTAAILMTDQLLTYWWADRPED